MEFPQICIDIGSWARHANEKKKRSTEWSHACLFIDLQKATEKSQCDKNVEIFNKWTANGQENGNE